MKDIKVEIKVDKKNRVVEAFVKELSYGTLIAKAKSRCHEEDEFDEKFGSQLAKQRALLKVLKREITTQTQALEFSRRYVDAVGKALANNIAEFNSRTQRVSDLCDFKRSIGEQKNG